MKIFVSSTFQDLQEHRKRVIEAMDRLRHNGVEIEWRGMKAFAARDDLPSDACIQFVDECDLYVGFFGVRYGSIDPKSNKSMTEVEYRRAVEKNKPRLMFLLSDDAPVKQNDFETQADAQEKLRQFKEDLKKDRVIDFFGSPEDLASKVATALAKHLPISNLQSLIPIPPAPYFVHPYPLQANFKGRVSERATLNDWLTHGERKTEAVFVHEAIGGMGKSALTWYWLNNDVGNVGFGSWGLAGAF